jgi:hypothetical protein
MSSRSLRASETGIQRARQALARRNLIQKSLAEEGLASWSTINNFFNGKVVLRSIFLEICHRLDLDWEAIAETPSVSDDDDIESPPPPKQDDSAPFPPQFSAIQQLSTAYREALTPRILERIPRSVVQDKYLGAIARGTETGLDRVIALIAPAGYGKSTILGHLYDELIQSSAGWVGLILCSHLHLPASPSANDLAISLGQGLSGELDSIVPLTQHLTQTHGRGVLLIDTIDLVINKSFVLAFATLLRQLLNTGTTIVFTCRDHEYNDFLEPTREKLLGVAQSVDRYTVPEFTTAEIRLAATTFFTHQAPYTPERGQAFADQILQLSADSRSLHQITQNPLLLALLCDLFAQDGHVPADLTVSKLYKRYWQEKIAYSRSDQSHFAALAVEKDRFCLTLARSLFARSQEKLCESAYEDDLEIEFTPPIIAARNDLFSEGVLDRLPSTKLHFFHQTLLEYAIAYWLTRHSAQPQRDQLLESLRQPQATDNRTYWLPILRQHLTIVESEAEFEHLVSQLNPKDIGVFGTIAFAAVSRDRPDALLHLLPTALHLGEAHQRRLRQALESAPQFLIEGGWSIFITLLEQAEHTTAINTAKMLGLLLSRWWDKLGQRLPELLEAVARRDSSVNRQVHQADDRTLLLGWLLQPCLPLLQKHPDLSLLAALRSYYPLLGHNSTGIAVIILHQAETVPLEARQDFLYQLMAQDVPNDRAMGDTLAEFVALCLPALISYSPDWPSWSAILERQYLKGWDSVLARSVGRCAGRDDDLLSTLLHNWQQSRSDLLRRHFIAVGEVLQQGKAETVVQFLTHQSVSALDPNWFRALLPFLSYQAATFSPDHQEQLAQWLQQTDTTDSLLLLFDALATDSPTARSLLERRIAQLPAQKQASYRVRLLRFQPIDHHPPLKTLDKSAQQLLLQHYQKQAPICATARGRLLEACQSDLKHIATQASQTLDQLPHGSLTVVQVLPLLQSRFAGVRVKALQAIAAITQPGALLTEADFVHICTVLQAEDNQAVVRPLCELVSRWVKAMRQVPPAVAGAIGTIPARLMAQGTFEGGTGRVVIDALKGIAQSEDSRLDPLQVSHWLRDLLRAIDLIKIPHGEMEMIDLLSAGDRHDPQLLPTLVREDCPELATRRWFRNLYAVIRAIRRVEGPTSELLDQILSSPWCVSEVRGIILEVRGA